MSDTDKSDNTPAYAFSPLQRLEVIEVLTWFAYNTGVDGLPSARLLNEVVEKLEAVLYGKG